MGTTSLAGMLAQDIGGEVLFEEVRSNPFLPEFYKNREKNAFNAQLSFLVSRCRQLKHAAGAGAGKNLFKHRVVADYMMEKDRIFAELNLNQPEFELYNDVYGLMSVDVARPDLVIFLTAQTETLVQRVKKRGSEFEVGITEEYIEEVNQAYHRFFFRYESGPMLQVNTNDIDFVNNKEDFRKLLDKISSPVKGREFFNPLGSV